MTQRYDVAVCGLGVMGSAALFALARRGRRVIGLDRFPPGHDRGSSHGETRIIRLAYFEHPSYVPLLRRAYELWRTIESMAGRRLLHITGIVEIGPPQGALVAGSLAAAHIHGIPHERLPAGELMQRYPAFRVPRDWVGVVQRDGGFIEAEMSVHALQALAQMHGAQVMAESPARALDVTSAGLEVMMADGTIEAETAIVAAGPWTGSLLPNTALPLRVTRQVMGWFQPTNRETFDASRSPVFLIESAHGIHYGFPSIGNGGVKIAKHHHADEAVNPDAWNRTVSLADEALIRAAIIDHLPAANGPLIDARTCLYTMAPDGDFIIDRLPGAPIVVASPCSGHGFKFAPVIGEILADLATLGKTEHDISRFRLARFG